ncbi:MAG: DpnI domain-containing protein [Patescibacteria group bacterium]
MNLSFNIKLADEYTNSSQKIRVLTEDWVDKQVYCPNCGHADIDKYANNKPVADFFCSNCNEDFELKSKKGFIGNKILDGAYHTMIERLRSTNNPNFFILKYDIHDFSVLDFFVIPKHYFVLDIIQKRRALSQTARRAGWIGCNILLQSIPQTGKIFFVKDHQIESKESVMINWQKTLFLREEKEIYTKGWLLDIMNCIERLGNNVFSLDEIYVFEKFLGRKHPENKHIKDKIRQQLQILRDKRYLKFTKRGNYQLT